MHQLLEQIREASRAHSFRDHIAPGFVEPHVRSAKKAVAVATYRLTELLPKLPVSKAETLLYAGAIDARKSTNTVTMKAAIMEQSRVAQAGAQVLLFNHENRAVPGLPGAIYSNEGRLQLIKPAPFGPVIDGQDVETSAYPIVAATFGMGDAPSSAVHFSATRRAQKSIPEDQMAYEIMESLAQGIAHEMDRVLLQAIAARTLATFSFGAAAAKGLKFDQLRALVGTNGSGAAVNAAGNLAAMGVPAELTDTVAETIFGAWNSAAVGVMDSVDVHLERKDVAGNLTVTAFINVIPVLADPSLFWKLS